LTTHAAPRHLGLVGPTASGKSDVALEVAEALGDVEIVSMDSMQVYRGLDIGTAKPTAAERARVPHHLVDVVDPDDEWSVVRFQAAAREAIAGIEARGHRALLVGGTGLYVRAIVDGLCFADEDRVVRARWEARTATPDGLAAAYDELARRDPVAAARIDPGNARRVARALEAIEVTGRRFSDTGPGLARHGAPALSIRLAGLWLPRETVRARIARRVQLMRAAGLLDEVRGLAARGPTGLSRTARQAIGYKELLVTLEAGSGDDPTSIEAAFTAIEDRTRQFARRQRMWFRRDPRIVWFGTRDNPLALAPALLQAWRR
jgi:tRNA dimethylallyltransferase